MADDDEDGVSAAAVVVPIVVVLLIAAIASAAAYWRFGFGRRKKTAPAEVPTVRPKAALPPLKAGPAAAITWPTTGSVATGSASLWLMTPPCPKRGKVSVVPPIDQRVPYYWNAKSLDNPFSGLENPDKFEVEAIQKMIDDTWREVATRDRRNAKLPRRLRVVKVQRVENSELWKRYTQGRHYLKSKRPHSCTPLKQYGGELVTGRKLPKVLASSLQTRVNECLLWHGTSPKGASSIAAGGMKLAYGGTNAGSMYAKGLYFAECSSKSDEYTTDEPEGDNKGLCCLLLCRVVLGELLHLTAGGETVYPMIKAAIEGDAYDSVLGDREASVGTYREFVVYSEDQVYPEYMILYKREY